MAVYFGTDSARSHPKRPKPVTIAIIGDYDAATTAHRGIDWSLALAVIDRPSLQFEWIPTDAIVGAPSLERYDGIWCAPRTPYRSVPGALAAIRFARESQRPFLGTCGGFQYALIEYAHDVLQLPEAAHAEDTPDAAMALIAPLSCAMVEADDEVQFEPGSILARAYGGLRSHEGYHCRYGLNPQFETMMTNGGFHISARDTTGSPRAFEFRDHPFFVGTLFQPERAALYGAVSPVVRAFLDAAAAFRDGRE
jgi:CTP synthase (UTP-ammonia lyase)